MRKLPTDMTKTYLESASCSSSNESRHFVGDSARDVLSDFYEYR